MTKPADALAPLIVLEGIDGSGKGTQAAGLHARLNSAGIPAGLLSFPRYQSTFFGSRIGEFLNGEFGTLDQLNPFLISLLYAGDRFESKTVLEQARRDYDLVVLDRYVPSNVAHQSAKETGGRRRQLREWIEQVEYRILGLPEPDQVFLMDLPVEVSQNLIHRKQQRTYTDQKADLQEADVTYLANVRDAYLDLARTSTGWQLIPVVQHDALRSVEEIGDEIYQHVRQRFLTP